MLATRRIQPHGGAAFDAVGAGATSSPAACNVRGNCAVIWVMTYPFEAVTACSLGSQSLIASSAAVGPKVKTASVINDNNTAGIQAIAVLGPLRGSQSITLSLAGSATYGYINWISYYNIGAIGTPVTLFGTNAPNMASLTYPSGAIMAQGFGGYAFGSLAFSSPKFTQRISNSQGSTVLMIAGDQTAAHGAANGTSATTNNSGGYWGGISIPLLAA